MGSTSKAAEAPTEAVEPSDPTPPTEEPVEEEKPVKRPGLAGEVQAVLAKVEKAAEKAETSDVRSNLNAAAGALVSAIRDLDWAEGRDAHGKKVEG